jgi:Na+/H+ antiporter NhaD/arsenite permease-like protein
MNIGQSLAWYTTLPFVALLLCIAIMPLYFEEWWSKIRNQAIVVFICSIPIFIYFLMIDWHQLAHTGLEYISFIIYVGGLFTVAGGIFLKGDILATPRNNTLFLAMGAILANVLGTTGASMLLIRPMLTMNQDRRHIIHIPIFFIFIVSNIGGTLTPLGDPPLFLGFLRGVPFEWTLKLFPEWLFSISVLLALFFVIDSIAYKKETREDLQKDQQHFVPISIIGKRNFILLAIILVSVILTKTFHGFYSGLGFVENADLFANLTRDGIIFITAVISYYITPDEAHQSNEFSFHPLEEVAVLFIGLFITMIPALLILQAKGSEFGITTPAQFFWYTGLLSSFLDNAPTYLSFTALAQGVLGVQGDLNTIIQHSKYGESLLIAISLGAVFMGANSYIGNAPNFMVKNITEKRGIKMPSFGGYLLWSGGILIPLFVVVNWLFL